MKTWNSPAGPIKLKRHPFAGEKSHQAWDAADDWIVSRFTSPKEPLVIAGEAFGVLGTVWGSCEITAINDSLLSHQALSLNRGYNPESSTGDLNIVFSTTVDQAAGTVKKIFIRLPKNLELLDVYIRLALQYAGPDTEIWIGGMDKRWNRGVQKTTENLLDVVNIFPFERHARWIQYRKIMHTNGLLHSPKSIEWDLERYPVSILSAQSVFSSSVLDAGTSAFIEAFPEAQAEKAEITVDLGCGSGVLGLCAAYLNRGGRVIFTDESFLAVQNAKSNFRHNNMESAADFLNANGAEGIDDASVDLVLCNPPFHYQNIQSREPAEFLFSEAKRILKPGGTIQIVGNSHLGYHKLLKNYFANATDVLRNNKFTVMRGSR